MSLQNLFDDYCKAGLYLKGWSPKTVTIYKRAFTSFQKSLHQPPEFTSSTGEQASSSHCILTKAHLESWVISRRATGMSPSGINIYIRALNAFCAWLKEEGYTDNQTVLKQLKAPIKPVEVFSEKDISLILSFKPKGFYELRTWTLLCFLLDTGCRIDEALQLVVVDFDNLMATVTGKGSKTRIVPISVELRKTLFRFNRHRGKYFFCSRNGTKLMYRNVMRDVRNLCKKVGITKHVKLHLTRHTFACHFMKNGGSIYTLSRILGHSSVSTTQVYIRGLGVEDFQEEHSRLSPLVRR